MATSGRVRTMLVALAAAAALGVGACGEEDVERGVNEGAREAEEAGREAGRAGEDAARDAVGLLAVVAVAALGLALWALLTQEEERDARGGASAERVSDLEDRVDDLESDAEQAPSREDL